jgi:hypothetical protein
VSDTAFDSLANEIHAWACGKGFYDRARLALPEDPSEPRYAPARTVENPSLPSEKLMLIVTEVAEAQEALRNGDRENEAEEVADILIRVLDYAAWRGKGSAATPRSGRRWPRTASARTFMEGRRSDGLVPQGGPRDPDRRGRGWLRALPRPAGLGRHAGSG